MLAREAEGLAAPRALEDLDRLQRAAVAGLLRYLQSIEFLVAIAHPDAEAQAATREHVDHGRVLGQPQRMIERGEQHVGAEGEALGPRGDRGQHRHYRREVAVVDEVMLRHPDRMESGALDEI